MRAPDLYVRPQWGMDWDGPADAAEDANRMLAQISPPSENQTWLHCFYEPGERWQPVERLLVAQMTPMRMIAAKDAFFKLMGEADGDSLFAELEGPPPADAYYYDKVKGEIMYRAEILPPSISQRQWQLWREKRAFARVLWIVQGKEGGHKRDFSKLEQKILKFAGRPHQSPFAGELSFAYFDERILGKLQEMDRLADWMQKNSASWEMQTVEDRNRKRTEAMEEIDSRIYAWLDSQVEDIATRDIGSRRTVHRRTA